MRGLEQIPWLYDLTFWVMELLGLKRWRRWLVGGAQGLTLDVGCGTGRNLPLYSGGVRVVGLDPNRDVLLKARRRAPGVPLVRGSAEALPFRDGAFQTVVSGLVFCSVPDPVKGFVEVKRVLRPDGRLRLIEHVRAKWRWRAWLQDLIQPAWVCLAGGCHTNRDTERNVELAGFDIQDADRAQMDNFRKFSARPR
ncbi:MAG: class I SAM-dependent methyltransferase [Myxococcaceae bacterium]